MTAVSALKNGVHLYKTEVHNPNCYFAINCDAQPHSSEQFSVFQQVTLSYGGFDNRKNVVSIVGGFSLAEDPTR